MNAQTAPTHGSTWLFGVLPPLILNAGALLLYGAYYALQAVNSAAVQGVSQAEIQFLMYGFIFIIEWVFALALIARMARRGVHLRQLIAPSGDLFSFRALPAVLVFLFVNAALGAYVLVAAKLYGQWPRMDDLQVWQRAFMLLPVPLTAAFCEELIWRGHLIPELEVRRRMAGRKRAAATAVVLVAISFATIHGIFLLDKLVLTFILGVGMGIYYTRERHLVPLMFSHFVADVWTFALSVL